MRSRHDRNTAKASGGFALLELVVTAAILGLLIALGIAWLVQHLRGPLGARTWVVAGFAGVLIPIALIAAVDWLDKYIFTRKIMKPPAKKGTHTADDGG